ncbi:MAG: 5-(carboxyamino)imidazole ribonucleotide mutase [Proteobacteria bacterium]|jgi:5-(carboxyamino)imidazole ribonucleotide mutase|nr:5-(carboxyamino)imidazole ribonucleotide mutase [Pseudomonadota bacterium]
MKNGVLIVMGSVNDLPKVEPAIEVLKSFDIPYRATIASAHRSPERAAEIARKARSDGFGVIIAAAGGAHHLGGAMAANTTLPVIALPIAVGGLGGLDALLSAVQMPGGVPIASVGIDGAKNAGLIAASILSATDEQLASRLDGAREKQRVAVEESDRGLQLQLSSED